MAGARAHPSRAADSPLSAGHLPLGQVVLRIGAGAPFAMLLLASLAKLLDISAFAVELRTWSLIPGFLHAPLSLAVPVLEGAAALAWFLGLWRAAALGAATLLVAAFTAMYAAQAVVVGPPSCACFGALVRYEESIESAWLLIGRNVLMLAALIGFGGRVVWNGARHGSAGEGHGPGASDPSKAPARGDPWRSGRAGFTLIELLIVIAIIAIVVSLTIPSLAGVKAQALELKSLANLRTHALTHSVYAGDNQDSFLYVSDPEATSTILRGGGLHVAIRYFDLSLAWNVALADEYYGGDVAPDSMRIPWKPSTAPYTAYNYGECFIARPEYWNYPTRLAGTSQWRSTSLTEVTYPSAKGLVFEREWAPLLLPASKSERDARFALVDGSSREAVYQELRPAYIHGNGNPGPSGNGGYGWGLPVMHTIDGVFGRDLP